MPRVQKAKVKKRPPTIEAWARGIARAELRALEHQAGTLRRVAHNIGGAGNRNAQDRFLRAVLSIDDGANRLRAIAGRRRP